MPLFEAKYLLELNTRNYCLVGAIFFLAPKITAKIMFISPIITSSTHRSQAKSSKFLLIQFPIKK
ncbi:TPA: hypothetical protein DGH83_02055 [Candidatus Peregrinibacteria bacterium]|nr:hypothetical protein [Candidatus Peregrinibacteria bacterium]